MHETFPKVAHTGFSRKKSPPRKWSSLKPQHLPFTNCEAERVVEQRTVLLQVRKIKELKDKLCNVQSTIEEVKHENRLLTRLQNRHMKALQKYEGPQSNIQQLITWHSNEVMTLRDNLRAAQEKERGLSRKLKIAESELLKTKDNLLRLQRLSEDKNLAEREELHKKLSSLLIKKEIDSNKVKSQSQPQPPGSHFLRRYCRWQHAAVTKSCCRTIAVNGHILTTCLLRSMNVVGDKAYSTQSSIHFFLLFLQALEKELHVKDHFYHQQLAQESRKTYKAQNTIGKLQEEILLLKQTIKEKERELHIKNIYARRMPRNLSSCISLYGQGGLIFTKSTQTDSEIFMQDLPSAHKDEESGDSQDRNIESENDNAREEDDGSQMTCDEVLIHEIFSNVENDDFLEIDEKYKDQDKESSTDAPNLQISAEQLVLLDKGSYGKIQLGDLSNENEVDSGRNAESSDTRSFLPRLGRRNTFADLTEHLHQGLLETKSINSTREVRRCKSLMLLSISSLSHEELSLPKIDTGNCSEKKKLPEVSLSNQKIKLMEELFGPGYNVKNSLSSDSVPSDVNL
ncbi:Lebercilin-like protein [Pristimantis euphronides]